MGVKKHCLSSCVFEFRFVSFLRFRCDQNLWSSIAVCLAPTSQVLSRRVTYLIDAQSHPSPILLMLKVTRHLSYCCSKSPVAHLTAAQYHPSPILPLLSHPSPILLLLKVTDRPFYRCSRQLVFITAQTVDLQTRRKLISTLRSTQ